MASRASEEIVAKIKDIQIGDPIIDYNNKDDRERVLRRDPHQEPGQEFAIISYIDGEAGTFMVRACVKDEDAVTEHLMASNKKREQLGLPHIKKSSPIPTGVWVSWPPKPEYMTKTITHRPVAIQGNDGTPDVETETVVHNTLPSTSEEIQQQNIDRIQRQHFTQRMRATKAWMTETANKAGIDYEDIADLLTPAEREVLRNIR